MDNIVNAKGTDLPPSRQPPLPPPSPMQQQSQKVISQVSNPLNQKSAIKKELENIQQQSLVQKSVDRFNAKAIVGRKPSTSAPCLPTAKSLIPADKPRIEITAVSAPQISAANPGNNLPLNTRKRWFDDIPDEVLRERIISSMTKEQKLRQEVSFELLVTEGYYLRDLSTLLDTYGKPLRTNRKGQRWPELEELFSHIEQLMPVNQVLLDELKKCRRGFVMNAMGEAFLVVADYLKIYTGYCGMQNKTVDYIQRLHKQDSTFKAILKDIYTSPLFIGQNFESYLIKPVQRICKYPLLIRVCIVIMRQ